MKKYKCHKVVEAGKITGISREFFSKLIIEDHGPVEVGQVYMERHNPYPGGYYVQYEDGYQSFSPAGAFENGYKEIE